MSECGDAVAAKGQVFLLLEACGYEGFFIAGAFSTQERAEQERIKECLREKRDPQTDRIYRVKELALDTVISGDARYLESFGAKSA